MKQVVLALFVLVAVGTVEPIGPVIAGYDGCGCGDLMPELEPIGPVGTGWDASGGGSE